MKNNFLRWNGFESAKGAKIMVACYFVSFAKIQRKLNEREQQIKKKHSRNNTNKHTTDTKLI